MISEKISDNYEVCGFQVFKPSYIFLSISPPDTPLAHLASAVNGHKSQWRLCGGPETPTECKYVSVKPTHTSPRPTSTQSICKQVSLMGPKKVASQKIKILSGKFFEEICPGLRTGPCIRACGAQMGL